MAEQDYFGGYKIGGYRLGTNLPMQGAVWENVARASRWGAPVIEINTAAETLGTNALHVIKEMAQANDLTYTWHIPPDPRQSGELALPDEQQNSFARDVFMQAIKASLAVGAKHITFHPSLQAGRPTKDAVWVYSVQEKKAGAVKVPEGMTRDEAIRMYDESAKAELSININQINSQLSLVKPLGEVALAVEKYGINREKVIAMKDIVDAINTTSSTIRFYPPDVNKWNNIKKKVDSGEQLSSEEEGYVRAWSKTVKQQVNNYLTSFENNLKQLKPFAGKDHLMLDGEEFLKQNVADNFGKMVDSNKKLFDNAMSEGLSIGIENLPGHQLFSTPDEMNDIRRRIVEKLVEKGFERSKAENFVGFTFDLSHANTIKYMDINGKRYASAGEFPDKLKGPIKHVHLSDTVGTFDSHLPLGQGELVEQEFAKMKEALKKSGFKGTSVHELGGSQTPALYQATMAFVEPGLYSIGEVPSTSQWGPSYLMAAMTDPIVFSSKETGYFHETFGEIF